MKKAKRILVFAILAAMLLSLCGCGMFRTHVAKAAIKMSKLDSLHADIEIQIGMGISVLGQDVNADATVTGGADIQRDPERVYVNMNAEVAGFEQNLLFYGVGRDDGFDVYSSVDSGDSWTTMTAQRTARQTENRCSCCCRTAPRASRNTARKR